MTEELVRQSPKLSVVSITYNQQDYVREALDSFVAQKTDFPVECIVSDDASTDATPKIIQEYADRHPELFRPILRTENVGIHANLTDALSATRGEYVALCEGDDFWTDPLKLSKQVDFLSRHPQVSVCFHPVVVRWEDGRDDDSEFPPVSSREDLSVSALISQNFIQTNSVVYRRLPHYRSIPAEIMPLDWFLHVLHATHGEIAMMPETMAVYRRHPQGIWWHDSNVESAKFWVTRGRGYAAMWEAMLDLFPGEPVPEGIVGRKADWLLRTIAAVPGPEARAALLNIVEKNPRFAMLALENQWNQTSWQRFKTLVRSLRA